MPREELVRATRDLPDLRISEVVLQTARWQEMKEIQYDTSFEGKAAAVETITPMLDADGVWRVSGYYIR